MKPIYHRFYPRCDMWASRPATEISIIDPLDLDFFDDNDDGLNDKLVVEPANFLIHLLGAGAPNKPPQRKHRIRFDLNGFSPKNVKTELNADKTKLVVSAKEGERVTDANDERDFYIREQRRTFKLPENIDTDKMASFVTRNGQLIIEIPFKVAEKQPTNETAANKRKNEDHVESSKFEITTSSGEEDQEKKKKVKWSFDLPENVDASKIKVTCKDRDVIVEATDKQETADGVSQIYFYRRSTLPEHADADGLKCVLENNKLMIEAPCLVGEIPQQPRSIPIENKQTSSIEANKEN